MKKYDNEYDFYLNEKYKRKKSRELKKEEDKEYLSKKNKKLDDSDYEKNNKEW